MKKLIVTLFLLFVLSASAQQITWEEEPRSITAAAAAKIEAEDHEALVRYAARLLREIEKYQRKIDALKKVLSRVERGELKAHEIPDPCPNCLTFSSTN